MRITVASVFIPIGSMYGLIIYGQLVENGHIQEEMAG